MKLGLAYFHGYDQAKVDLEKEMGLKYVISGPHQLDPSLPAQSYESLKLLKDKYRAWSFPSSKAPPIWTRSSSACPARMSSWKSLRS